MSQKTLFTKSALAVAVALISTRGAWSAGFQLNEFSSLWPLGRAYSGKVQLPMMQVTLAVTPH